MKKNALKVSVETRDSQGQCDDPAGCSKPAQNPPASLAGGAAPATAADSARTSPAAGASVSAPANAPVPAPATAPTPETVQVTKAELEELKKKAEEGESWLNMLKRVKADFDNYQKRVEREREENRNYLAQAVLCDILPIVDNLERAITSGKDGKNVNAVTAGVQAIYQDLLRIMDAHDVKPIEACGKCFDPLCHEAICCVETDAAKDDTVLEELRKGYKLHDRVLRPAQVKVAKRKAAEEQPAPAAGASGQ